ncbi:MAG: sensor histidine kinase [Ferruginibacter sp.]
MAEAQQPLNKDSLLKVINTSKDDSVKAKLYFLLAREYFNTDANESERYCIEGGALSRKIKYRDGIFEYYTQHANILNFKGDLDSAFIIHLQALDYAKTFTDSSEIGRTMLNAGIGSLQLENYEMAVSYMEGAKDIFIRNDVHQYDGSISDLLQLLYNSMHQYRKAANNGLNAVRIFEQTNNKKDKLQQAYTNLGLNYINLQLYDSARLYLNKAFKMANEDGDVYILMATNLNYALLSLRQLQYDSIKVYAGRALALSKKYDAKEFEGMSQYGMAYYYLLEKDYSNSKLFADSAMQLAKRYNMRDIKKRLYALLSNLYYALQDSRQGAYYFNEYELLSDSVLNESISNSTIRIEKRFEMERKETQIKLQQEQLKQKTILNYFLIGGAAALLAISLLGFRNYKNRQKLQQAKIDELETGQLLTATEAVLKGEEQERTRLAKDLHDGLGGMLSGIKYSLNSMKDNMILTPDNTQAFERSIDMLDSSIREMRRVAHNMMPEILVKYGLDASLKEFCSEIDRSGVIHVNYQSVGVYKSAIEQTTAVTIYRIVQELVNNAIKHAHAKNVLVQLHQSAQEQLLAITIEDDGTGFDTALLEQSGGLGWRSIKNRVEFLKGRIDIQSSEGKGTSVMIEITTG